MLIHLGGCSLKCLPWTLGDLVPALLRPILAVYRLEFVTILTNKKTFFSTMTYFGAHVGISHESVMCVVLDGSDMRRMTASTAPVMC